MSSFHFSAKDDTYVMGVDHGHPNGDYTVVVERSQKGIRIRHVSPNLVAAGVLLAVALANRGMTWLAKNKTL